MNSANQKKILKFVHDLSKHVKCPKCCQENDSLYNISCGHILCSNCLYPSSNTNKINQKLIDCPICDKRTNLAEIFSDDLLNSLASKTAKLKELFFEETKSVLANCDIYRDKPFDKPTSNKMQDIQHIKDSFNNVEESNFSDNKAKPECKDRRLQTEGPITHSVEIQCDLTEKTTFSIGTQTDFQSTFNNCCIKENMEKILQLNICDSFNAVILGLIGVDKCGSRNSKISTDNIENNTKDIDKIINDSEKELDEIKSSGASVKRSTIEIDTILEQNICFRKDTSKPIDVKSASLNDKDISKETFNSLSTSNEDKIVMAQTISADIQLAQSVEPNMKREEISLLIESNIKTKKSNNNKTNEENKSGKVATSTKRVKSSRQNRKRQIANVNEDSSDDCDSYSKSVTKSKRINQSKKKVKNEESNEVFKEPKLAIEKQAEVKKLPKNYTTIKSIDMDSTGDKSDTSTSSASRGMKRSSSNEKKTYVIMCSGMDSNQKRKLEKASNTFDFQIVTNWSSNVTHLVMNLARDSLKKDLFGTRSIKYLMALVGHRWIVSFDWIAASLNSNRMVDEQKYEIRGVRNCTKLECPKLSRTQKFPFFANCVVYFKEPFTKFPGDVNDVKKVVQIGSGIVVNSQEELSRQMKENLEMKFLIVTDNDITLSKDSSAKHITINQFIDAITNLQLTTYFDNLDDL